MRARPQRPANRRSGSPRGGRGLPPSSNPGPDGRQRRRKRRRRPSGAQSRVGSPGPRQRRNREETVQEADSYQASGSSGITPANSGAATPITGSAGPSATVSTAPTRLFDRRGAATRRPTGRGRGRRAGRTGHRASGERQCVEELGGHAVHIEPLGGTKRTGHLDGPAPQTPGVQPANLRNPCRHRVVVVPGHHCSPPPCRAGPSRSPGRRRRPATEPASLVTMAITAAMNPKERPREPTK